MPVDAEVLREWSQLHDGYDADRSRLVRRWLGFVHGVAAPLARWRVPPTAVTVVGVCLAVAAVWCMSRVAALLVALASVCDGLDGAVALQRGIAGRPHAAAIDHGADRVTDVVFAAVLWHAGAPLWVAAVAAAATIGYEATRSVLRRLGRDLDVVTPGERPIRVSVVVVFVIVSPAVGAAAVAVLCVVSLVRMVWASRRCG